MRTVHILAASAATLAVAVPAAAQTYYPQPQPTYPQYQYPQQGAQAVPQPYPGQPGYNYQQPGYAHPGQQPHGQNAIGQMINQMLGNRYNVTERAAVTQCATAATHQAAAQYRPRGYGQPQYGSAYGQQGYDQHSDHASMMRVTSITDVRRLNRGVRVSGQMSSGMQGGYPPYGQAHGYHNQARADLNFRCNVANNGQVTNVRIGRNQAYRGR